MVTATINPVRYGNVRSLVKFSLESYHRMTASGILTPEDKVESLENYVVLKMPRYPSHDCSVQRGMETSSPVKPQGWSLQVQSAVTLPDSQPEPDFTFARGSAFEYSQRHSRPSDIGLLVEVADSSQLRGQRDKTRIYPSGNVPVYWIVNLVDRRIEVHTQPSGPTDSPAYGSCQVYVPGQEVPLALDGAVPCSVSVEALLPE